ncbi:hypothetical protein EVG20_g751 [Dentipellis fragilis]|uniref:Uncharacterized protein n=1 Tax=Dentipellis fragilis TaxID=205917 RepID=A0A4Y9ZDM2_9AGAM|nr:hypothetical protein EVG20_g751 [Dentipellis fragilis]
MPASSSGRSRDKKRAAAAASAAAEGSSGSAAQAPPSGSSSAMDTVSRTLLAPFLHRKKDSSSIFSDREHPVFALRARCRRC